MSLDFSKIINWKIGRTEPKKLNFISGLISQQFLAHRVEIWNLLFNFSIHEKCKWHQRACGLYLFKWRNLKINKEPKSVVGSSLFWNRPFNCYYLTEGWLERRAWHIFYLTFQNKKKTNKNIKCVGDDTVQRTLNKKNVVENI